MTRIEEEISDRVETATANAEEVLEALTEAKIPHFSVRADDQITRVRYRIVKVMDCANWWLLLQC